MERGLAVDPARAGLTILMIGGIVVIWFAGFDVTWAIATMLALGVVGGAFIHLGSEENVDWDPSGPETLRGVRLDLAALDESLAACGRLAQPDWIQRMRALLDSQAEDRLSRLRMVRRMQALLAGELRARGLDPELCEDDAVVYLLGPDAMTILRPDRSPITAPVIERCLDALDRLNIEPPTSK